MNWCGEIVFTEKRMLKRECASFDLLLDVAWIETMRVDWEGNHSGVDENQDLQRELAFYNQAAESVKVALKNLQDLNVAVDRPDDYFAEMVKR